MENKEEQMFNSSDALKDFENMGGVNPSIKKVGIMFFCDGLSIQEIAKKLDMSPNTIQILKQGAQRFLNSKGHNVDEYLRKIDIPDEESED